MALLFPRIPVCAYCGQELPAGEVCSKLKSCWSAMHYSGGHSILLTAAGHITTISWPVGSYSLLNLRIPAGLRTILPVKYGGRCRRSALMRFVLCHCIEKGWRSGDLIRHACWQKNWRSSPGSLAWMYCSGYGIPKRNRICPMRSAGRMYGVRLFCALVRRSSCGTGGCCW